MRKKSVWAWSHRKIIKTNRLYKFFLELGQSRPTAGKGLVWIVGPEYSLGVFSASRFAPAALRSVEFVVRIKYYKQTNAPYR